MTATLLQLEPSLPNVDDRRNFRSSPLYRTYYERADARAEVLRWVRHHAVTATDGHARAAADRIRMQRELLELAWNSEVASNFYVCIPYRDAR
jgi:hypothetical protein